VKFRYLIMNKPAGVVSATTDAEEKTVLDLLDEPLSHQNLCPAGRLDKDAEGLLVLTNDGAFVHKLSRRSMRSRRRITSKRTEG
jgi:16S rRNA pseudouridine516 synthase